MQLSHIDLEGHCQIQYQKRNSLISSPRTMAKAALDHQLQLILEPGRSIVADAGLLSSPAARK